MLFAIIFASAVYLPTSSIKAWVVRNEEPFWVICLQMAAYDAV
jgi:hypothetical protein